MRAGGWLLLTSFTLGCTHDFDAFHTGSSDASTDTVVPPVDTGPGCSPPGRTYENHCYFPLTAAVTWDDGKKGCAAVGAHLASINSSGEEAVAEAVVSGSDRWIGLRRDPGSPGVDASYKWITSEPVTYKTWAPGEPNGTGECVAIPGSGHWSDQDCTLKYVALCERE